MSTRLQQSGLESLKFHDLYNDNIIPVIGASVIIQHSSKYLLIEKNHEPGQHFLCGMAVMNCRWKGWLLEGNVPPPTQSIEASWYSDLEIDVHWFYFNEACAYACNEVCESYWSTWGRGCTLPTKPSFCRLSWDLVSWQKLVWPCKQNLPLVLYGWIPRCKAIYPNCHVVRLVPRRSEGEGRERTSGTHCFTHVLNFRDISENRILQ